MKRRRCLYLGIMSAMHISAGMFADKGKYLLMSEPEKKKGWSICLCLS